MIGSITKGSGFSGCVEYALALKEKNKEVRLLHSEGLLTDTPKDIVDGFKCQRHLNSRASTGADTFLYPIRRRIRHGFPMKPW